MIISSDAAYGKTKAACFDPHLGVVYYRNNSIVANIDVCLDCSFLISSESIPAMSYHKIYVLEDYSYSAEGFSAKTRKKIHTFCTKLGFDKYLKPLESVFDQQ